eukprot:762521-Hanusia_phi.AAC.4
MEAVVDLTVRSEQEVHVSHATPQDAAEEQLDDVSIIEHAVDEPANGPDRAHQPSADPSNHARPTADISQKRGREEGEESEINDTCMICFEQWTNSGEHRVVCLSCGHLFGGSCIKRWLSERKHCPTCNQAAKRRDIRTVFASNLVAVDTADKDRALEELKQERKLRLQAQERQDVRLRFDVDLKRLIGKSDYKKN